MHSLVSPFLTLSLVAALAQGVWASQLSSADLSSQFYFSSTSAANQLSSSSQNSNSGSYSYEPSSGVGRVVLLSNLGGSNLWSQSNALETWSNSVMIFGQQGMSSRLWNLKTVNSEPQVLMDTLSQSSTSGLARATFNGRYYYAAGGLMGNGIWSTDGTLLGTRKEWQSNSLYSQVSNLKVSGDKIFFVAVDTALGTELGVLSAQGVQILDLWTGRNANNMPNSSGPGNLSSLGDGRVMFKASLLHDNNVELWISDGTLAGTSVIKEFIADTNLGGKPSRIWPLAAPYWAFAYTNKAGQRVLARTNLTQFDSVLTPGPNLFPNDAFVFKQQMILYGDTGQSNQSEWWSFDGQQLRKWPSTASTLSSGSPVLVYAGTQEVLYWSKGSDGYYKLYAGDGVNTPHMVLESNPVGDSKPSDWYGENASVDALGHYWLRAFDGVRARLYEVWKASGTWNAALRLTAADTNYNMSPGMALLGQRPVFGCINAQNQRQLCGLNRPPIAPQSLMLSMALGTPAQRALMALPLNDPDGDPVTWSLDNNSWLTLSGDSLRVAQVQNGSVGDYEVGATLRDPLGDSTRSSIHIQVHANQAPSFIYKGDTLAVQETDAPMAFEQWFANPSVGPSYENWQKASFKIRPVLGASWLGFGPIDSLFSLYPQMDSLTGTLKFQLKTGVYTPGVQSLQFLISLRDQGGTEQGGVDSTQWYPLVVRIQNKNNAPFLRSPMSDTVRALSLGQLETLTNWLPPIAVGDTFERMDSTQRIRSVQIQVQDSSVFDVLPIYDLGLNQLKFQLKPTTQGLFSARLLIHDNGGVQGGGLDSAVYPLQILARAPEIRRPEFESDTGFVLQAKGAGPQTRLQWARNIQSGTALQSKVQFEIKPRDSAQFIRQGGWRAFVSAPQIDAQSGELRYEFKPDYYLPAQQSMDFVVQLVRRSSLSVVAVESSMVHELRLQVQNVNTAPRTGANFRDSLIARPGQMVRLSPWPLGLLVGDSVEQWQGDQQIQEISLMEYDPNLFQIPPQYDPSTQTLQFRIKPGVQPGVYGARLRIRDNGGVAQGGNDSLKIPIYFKVDPILVQNPSFQLTQNRVVLSEGQGLQVIRGFAQNMSYAYPELSQSHFELAPLDTAFVSLLGGVDALFKQRPNIDVQTGDLTFEFNPEVYTYLGRSFDVSVNLIENEGTNRLVSLPNSFGFEVQGTNDAPVLESLLPDTLKSTNPGQMESLGSWWPKVSVGNAFEAKDLNQGGLTHKVLNSDSSVFVVQPYLDLNQKTLNYKLKMPFAGILNLWLLVKDQGGTDRGGVDSLRIPLVIKVPRVGQNSLPIQPSFKETEIPYVRLLNSWQWTVDTSASRVDTGRGQIRLLLPNAPFYVRSIADSEFKPSAWVKFDWQNGYRISPSTWGTALALGGDLGQESQTLSNASWQWTLLDSSSQKLAQSTLNQTHWSQVQTQSGLYRLQAKLIVEESTMVLVDTAFRLSDSVLKQKMLKTPGQSKWMMLSTGTVIPEFGRWYHWEPTANNDLLSARYSILSPGTQQSPATAAWVEVDQDRVLDYTGRYVLEPVKVVLSAANEGWNQVANPYPFYLGEASVQDGDSLECWQWDRTVSDYVLKENGPGPFEACWVYVSKDRTLTFNPIAGPPPSAKAQKGTVARWTKQGNLQVGLSLFAGNYRDSGHVIALADRDSLIPSIPTIQGDRIHLDIVEGVQQLRSRWKKDSLGSWTIHLRSEVSGLSKGELRVQGLESLGEDWALYIRQGHLAWSVLDSVIPVHLGSNGSTMELKFARLNALDALDAYSVQLMGQTLWLPMVKGTPASMVIRDVQGRILSRHPLTARPQLSLPTGVYSIALENLQGQSAPGKIFFAH